MGTFMMKILSCAALLAATTLTPAFAQTATSAAQAESRPFALSTQNRQRAFPSIFGVSSAFPASGGTAYGSVTYTNPRGGIAGGSGDADVSLGFGLGSPTKNVGVNFGIDITGTTRPFGDAGAFSLSLSRALAVQGNSATFASISASQLGAFGTSKGLPVKYAATVSHVTSLGAAGSEFPIMLTAGYATQNTYSKTAIGTLSDGFFVGAGVGVAKNLSVSMSATQTQINLGASATIPGLNGVSVSLGVYDVANTVQRRQTALTVSYAMSNLFGR